MIGQRTANMAFHEKRKSFELLVIDSKHTYEPRCELYVRTNSWHVILFVYFVLLFSFVVFFSILIFSFFFVFEICLICDKNCFLKHIIETIKNKRDSDLLFSARVESLEKHSKATAQHIYNLNTKRGRKLAWSHAKWSSDFCPCFPYCDQY